MAEDSTERNVMPGFLGEIARMVGLPAAFAMAREYGGQNLYFPKRVARGHAFAKLLGLKTARLLCERFGGARHHVAASRATLHWYQAHALRHQEGLSHAAIGKRIGLTRKHVTRLLATGHPSSSAAGAPARQGPTPDRCPFCGHRHREGSPAPDPRQLALPL